MEGHEIAQPSTSNKRDNANILEEIQHQETKQYNKSMFSPQFLMYQLKLLMLFAYRGFLHYDYFRLATEWKEAGKFDDLVFQFHEDGKNVYRFLQAKHKLDESKKISLYDLFTERDEDFSLQKYFISFRKIKKEKEFNGENDELKDFIICTNIGISKKLEEEIFEIMKDEDKILDIVIAGENPKRLKFIKESHPTKDELISIFKGTSDLKRLAKKLSEQIFNTNPKEIVRIDSRVDIFKDNCDKLVGHVFIKAGNKIIIRKGFLDGDELPGNLNDFREALKKELKEKKIQFNDLDQYQFKISIHTCTEEEYKKHKSYFKNLDNLLIDEVTDEEIKEFLEKLVLAVNQPNEVKLGKFIEAKMANNMNLIESEFVASKFQTVMLDWMKKREGTFWTRVDSEAFFAEAKQKISKLTDEHSDKVETATP